MVIDWPSKTTPEDVVIMDSLNQEKLVKTKLRPVQTLVVTLTENMSRIKASEGKKGSGELDVHLIKQQQT